MAVSAAEDQLRELNEQELEQYIEILGTAYPVMRLSTPEAKEGMLKRMLDFEKDTRLHHYGLFRQGQLVGGMRFFDFTMNLHSTIIKAGGVGSVAVSFLHKKQKVAFNLIKFFLDYYRQRDTPLVLLYPFRPDFYKSMGFGYGTKISQYRVKPASLPNRGDKSRVFFLDKKSDESLFVECFNRYMAKTHGLIEKNIADMSATFHNGELYVAGYRREGQEQLDGYVSFSFKSASPDNFVKNNMIVKELVYNSTEALLGLLSFLQSQADQIFEIVFNMQDSTFHHLLLDPRNGTDLIIPPVSHESNLQGVGIMYRVVDTRRIFELLQSHDFGGQTARLKLTIKDTFYPVNAGSYFLHFEYGTVSVKEDGADFEVEIGLDVGEFSSLLVGVLDFKTLYKYGLATISDEAYLDTVNRLFKTDTPPICMSNF